MHPAPEQKKGVCEVQARCWGGDVAKLVVRRTGTPLRRVRFPGAARDFSPRVNFQRTLLRVNTALECNRMHEHMCAR